MPKFAVYYIPQADNPFYQLGTQILGYDIRASQVAVPSFEIQEFLGSSSGTWTTVCRPYGFHLTICEALDCHWSSIPRVEQELADLLSCFDPSHPFLLQRNDDHPVGIWGEEGSNSIVLLYEPNISLRMLHTLLVARLTPFGTGSGFLKQLVNSANVQRFLRRMVGNRRETWESTLQTSVKWLEKRAVACTCCAFVGERLPSAPMLGFRQGRRRRVG